MFPSDKTNSELVPTTTLRVTEVIRMLDSLEEQKQRLERIVKLLCDSSKISVPTNLFTWRTSQDSIWIFRIRGVSNVQESELVSSFCHNKFFKDLNDTKHDITMLPVALFDDRWGMRDMASQAMTCFKTFYKDKDWWDDKYFSASNFSRNLDKIMGVVAPNVIIFRGGTLDCLAVIEKLLHGLKGVSSEIHHNATAPSLNFGELWKMTHFELFGERVTIFKYD